MTNPSNNRYLSCNFLTDDYHDGGIGMVARRFVETCGGERGDESKWAALGDMLTLMEPAALEVHF